MECLFDILCSLLITNENKEDFYSKEGIQLMVLMLKASRQSKSGALRTLNFALSGKESEKLCDKFIEVAGLRYIFPYYMANPNQIFKHAADSHDYESKYT